MIKKQYSSIGAGPLPTTMHLTPHLRIPQLELAVFLLPLVRFVLPAVNQPEEKSFAVLYGFSFIIEDIMAEHFLFPPAKRGVVLFVPG